MIVLGFLMCLARIFFFILCRASLKCAGKSGFRSALPDYPDRYKSDQILCRKTLSKAGIKKSTVQSTTDQCAAFHWRMPEKKKPQTHAPC